MPILPLLIPARDVILYACVARGTTVLAEANSMDADLGVFAAKCVEIAPPFHSIFSHTARTKTYIFLTDTPLLYFAIFREKFGKSQGLAFLNSVKTAFNQIFPLNQLDDTLHPYCFQSQLNPVFHHLLQQSTEIQQVNSPVRQTIRLNPSREDRSMRLMKKNKKNRALISEIKASNSETCDDVAEIDNELKKDFSMTSHKIGPFVGDGGGGQHKAKKIWKKHVWVVLSLDLIVCSILFVTWLCICRGFKCVHN